VVDLEHADAIQQDLDDTAAEVVGDQQVRVKLVQLIDECFEHHSFVLKDTDVRMPFLFDPVLEVGREGQGV
jgi:hypothetical protein